MTYEQLLSAASASDMNRRFALYMLSRGMELGPDAAPALLREETTRPYMAWIDRMKVAAADAGSPAVRRRNVAYSNEPSIDILDHELFDRFSLSLIPTA